jgi:hypothetical protein
MLKPVALLDVDHTLLTEFFTPTGTILEHNTPLTEALKAKGIFDVYLLTDMKFSKDGVQERRELIEWLRGQGFTVHGVITPSDINWTAIPPHESLIYMDAGMQHFPKKAAGLSLLDRTSQYLSDRSTELPVMKDLLEYRPALSRPGSAFAEAEEFYFPTAQSASAEEAKSSDEEIRFQSAEHIYKHSDVTKSFCDTLSAHHGYHHSKGLLLDLFFTHKPGWVSSVVVVDDRADVIADASSFRPAFTPSPYVFPHLSGVRVLPDKDKRFTTPQKDYEVALEHHVAQDPVVMAFRTHITKLSSWSLFLRNADQKIAALNVLLAVMQRTPPQDLRREIITWQAENALVLAEHRNIFKRRSRPGVQTSTERLINSLTS